MQFSRELKAEVFLLITDNIKCSALILLFGLIPLLPKYQLFSARTLYEISPEGKSTEKYLWFH
jgi:hypothetical protein